MNTFFSDARRILNTIKAYLDMPNISNAQIEKLTIFAGMIGEMEDIIKSEGESSLVRMHEHLLDIQKQIQ
jgi:hypothetical protein